MAEIEARRPPGRLDRSSPLSERAPEVMRLLRETYPDARVALRFENPLQCLIAVILSAQSTDVKVNEVTEPLFQKYRTAEDWVRAPEAQLLQELKPTGFFNQKTKAVRGACRMIVEDFGGRVPDTMAELIRLPGVARKTANIVLWNSYPEKAMSDPDIGMAVDTHVKRVSGRLGLTEQKDPNKIERDLMMIVPKDQWYGFTYVLIDHGRAICKAPIPRCEECPVNHLCPASLV
ncbi:MAG: endonuclease III [Actinomycetota bacterium]|nr:endonuclease III [Actinomycetota bacterium]